MTNVIAYMFFLNLPCIWSVYLLLTHLQTKIFSLLIPLLIIALYHFTNFFYFAKSSKTVFIWQQHNVYLLIRAILGVQATRKKNMSAEGSLNLSYLLWQFINSLYQGYELDDIQKN